MCEMWKVGSSLDGSGSFTRTSFSSTGWRRQKMAVTCENTQIESYYKYPVCVSLTGLYILSCTLFLLLNSLSGPDEVNCFTAWVRSRKSLKRNPHSSLLLFALCSWEKWQNAKQPTVFVRNKQHLSSDSKVLGKLGGSLLEDVLGKMFSFVSWFVLEANIYICIKNAINSKTLYLLNMITSSVRLWKVLFEFSSLKTNKQKKLFPDSDSVLVVLTLPLCRSFLGPKQLVIELKTKFCEKKFFS